MLAEMEIIDVDFDRHLIYSGQFPQAAKMEFQSDFPDAILAFNPGSVWGGYVNTSITSTSINIQLYQEVY